MQNDANKYIFILSNPHVGKVQLTYLTDALLFFTAARVKKKFTAHA